ncbi:C25 family cysteine peptidase [Dyadobacter sp. CY312]|uniref:putative type IX secretion system sortase PorU2 n=1 Tax=Dyadobacter sp. CY312 TaxID=2907303 RepID=UPI001F1E5D92|nr:C25 family cysteine peptidase [Dyadobacter sp. CY312]MCE7041012.1 C25 family cysteine peptidase [Dyadobacter sp. CY312]
MKERHLRHKEVIESRFIHAAFRLFVVVSLLSILSVFSAKAQGVVPDEWISNRQTYLRIAITHTGLYSISGQELKQAGLPIENIPASALQIFRRGKEVAIEVKSNDTVKLNNQSSISFFGEANDGRLDSALYISPNAIPHSKYSLYSDTAIYFLTWRVDGLPGKRMTKSPNSTPADTINYHIQVHEELFTSHYSTGNFYPPGTGFNNGIARTEYDTGEGWTGKTLQNSWQTLDINTSGFIPSLIDQCEIELVLAGRASGKHALEIWTGAEDNLGRKINTINLTDFQPATFRFKLTREDLAKVLLPNGKIVLSVYANTGTISVSYTKWRYPQKTSLTTSNTQKVFHFDIQHHNSFWDTGNASNWEFYDSSDPLQLKIPDIQENGINLNNTSQIIAVKERLKVNSMRLIDFTPLDSLSDYLIVSHPTVRKTANGMDPVEEYANYRSSSKGGNYKVGVINIDEVFNRYNYGEPGPLAIRNMISSLAKKGSLKFVFLIGRSSDPQTARKRADARTFDMIPNAGWPGSDLALAMNIDSILTHVPAIPIGRINASTADEVAIYLQKVIDLEAQPASAPWRKNILHLSGGRSFDEIETFKTYTKSFEEKISHSSLAAHIETISKQTEQEVEQFPIEETINKGVALMTLFGHSGIDVTDIDIGYASDENRKYKNRPFYPAVIANGCALGSIFFSPKTISSDWIFSPNNGAVLFLAHTFNGLSSALKHYTDSFYDVLADPEFTSQPFGIIQKEAIRRNLQQHTTLSDIITAQQMNLHGDPAIRIFPATLSDYAFDSTAFECTDLKGNSTTSWSDSLRIKILVKNYGRYKNQLYKLSVTNSDRKVIYQTKRDAFFISDTLYIKITNPFSESGIPHLTMMIDPENEIAEESEQNNEYKLLLNIPEGGVFPLLPTNGFVTNKASTELIAQLASGRNDGQVVFEWDSTATFSNSQQRTVTINQSIARVKLNFPPGFKQIYWRVYLSEYPERKSVVRSILLNREAEDSIEFPEAIAFINGLHSDQIQEGDVFRFHTEFRNITHVSFKDSITVKIRHKTARNTETTFKKIAPLRAFETKDFTADFTTLGFPGKHFISVTFNSDSLPEAIYSNNEIHFTFDVIPDRTAPILTVHIDNRLLSNGDFVSIKPQIDIQVMDENKFLIRTDTTGIEVYIKEDCHMCPETRISLSNTVTNSYVPNVFQVRLVDLPKFSPGNYLLRVRVRDVSGNIAPEYRMGFEVADSSSIGEISVSPNPSTSYFRFSLYLRRSIPDQSVSLTVSDIYGKTVHRQTGVLHAGTSELLWEPYNLPSGIYFYRIENGGGKLHSYFGKNNHLRGKVIWLR